MLVRFQIRTMQRTSREATTAATLAGFTRPMLFLGSISDRQPVLAVEYVRNYVGRGFGDETPSARCGRETRWIPFHFSLILSRLFAQARATALIYSTCINSRPRKFGEEHDNSRDIGLRLATRQNIGSFFCAWPILGHCQSTEQWTERSYTQPPSTYEVKAILSPRA